MVSSAFGATFVINSATNTFTPTFRDLANTDAGNTTYWGWPTGTFDGGTNNELMENPAPTLGIGIGDLNGTLDQLGTADILSSGNDLFIGATGRTDTLRLLVPTRGTPGTGFTTLIFQGQTIFGSPVENLTVNLPQFPQINGVSPTFTVGVNAATSGSDRQGQWWAKYELPGNQASYSLDVTVTNTGGQPTPLTISRLTVDTLYSATGYSSDVAVVPEPGATALLAAGGLLMMMRLRRITGSGLGR